MKLRTFFALCIALIVFILSAILSGSISYIYSDRIKKQAGTSLSEVAFQMANNLDYFMWSRYSELTVFSKMNALKMNEVDEIQNLIDQLSVNIPTFSWVGMTDEKGKVIASTRGIIKGDDISKRPVFKEARQKTYVGDVHEAVLLAPFIPNKNGEPLQLVDISTPVLDNDGQFKGVLAAHLSWEWSKEIYKKVFQPLQGNRKNVEVFVVSEHENTVLLGPEKWLGKSLQLSSMEEAKTKPYGWDLEDWKNDKTYLTGFALGKGYENYPGLGWTVLVRQPEASAYASLKNLQKSILLIGLVIAILFAFIGWLLAYIITKPLNKISSAAKLLRKGKAAEIPENKGIKEIEDLSASLRVLLSDLTNTEDKLGKMHTLARVDYLTGLPNRLAIEDYLNEHVRHSCDSFTFFFLDLDGFKHVNDTMGHAAGDRLLQEVANRIQSAIHPDYFLARMGGDEFVIIAQFDEGTQSIGDLGDAIIASINEPYHLNEGIAYIGCSIGAACWPKADHKPEEVLIQADKALYESKRTGKNKMIIY
ncbi:diguanylate cyclase domain-containing protein [Bacillus sp. 1P06AnD]|uniref:sensor domain-containing diguanylate cyclase n=1 Tax=Bacillus sp. 1P06AnD TaxID=3132208 RepID=UPI0039A2D0C7